MGKLYLKMKREDPERKKLGYLPYIATHSRASVGTLLAASFCERLNSAGNNGKPLQWLLDCHSTCLLSEPAKQPHVPERFAGRVFAVLSARGRLPNVPVIININKHGRYKCSLCNDSSGMKCSHARSVKSAESKFESKSRAEVHAIDFEEGNGSAPAIRSRGPFGRVVPSEGGA
jgi:hypothetical protein